MRKLFLRLIPTTVLCCLALPSFLQAESDPAKIFKTNCVQCHSADGSGNTTAGQALHAKDLRSAEVQAKTDAALTEVIAKGKGKMPAFGAKIPADDITKLVAYIRDLAKNK
jgi:mono/diheme cytochrome c family protein